jgi:NAD(P)-dependent dehydrogenase (short-subunit alcohol dehydrogenase family)
VTSHAAADDAPGSAATAGTGVNPFPDLRGKVVLLTGATRGLGRAMAGGLAEAGARIAVVSRKPEACRATADELVAAGGDAKPFACHVGRWDAIDALVDDVYGEFGRVDVLINNAGMSPTYPSVDLVTEQYFDSVIGVNFKGPFRLSALVGTRMHQGEGGSIINISSTASLEASADFLPYAAAKAALNTFALSFAAAFSPNVRVNTICVGPFGTDVSEHWDDPRDPQRPGWTVGGSRIGDPKEIVAAALYFASDASSYTNGALLRMDGGPGRIGRH